MSTPSLPKTILLLPIQLLTLTSLLTPFILGLHIFTTSHRLNLLRLQKRADAFKPHIYTPFSLLLHPDSESGITRQDLEAAKAMKSARRAALFGPSACWPGLVTMPILLYLTIHDQEPTQSGTMIGVFAALALLLVVIIHCSIASTVHHYFSLVEIEPSLLFGEAVKTARQERLHSTGLKRVYLVLLFALGGVESRARTVEQAARYPDRQRDVEVEEFVIEGWETAGG